MIQGTSYMSYFKPKPYPSSLRGALSLGEMTQPDGGTLIGRLLWSVYNALTEQGQGVLRAQRRAGVSGKTSRDSGPKLDLGPEEEKDGPSGRRSPDQCAEGLTLKIDLNTCLVHSQED